VQEVVIGFGKELYRFRVGQTLVRIKLLPLEGYVLPNPTTLKDARLKQAFIYLAGPGIEILLVTLLWLLYGDGLLAHTGEYGMIAIQSLALAALLGAGFNLLPYAAGSGVSDGLGAILSLFAPDDVFRHRLTMVFVRRARIALLREQWASAIQIIEEGLERHPGDEQLLGLKAVATAAEGNQEQAFEMLEALGHPNDKPALLRHDLLLDAAWVVLLGNDEALIHEAEQACERARADFPDSVAAHLSLGRLLLQRGQSQPAFEVLLNGYRFSADSDEEPQLVALLVIAATRTQRNETAERFRAVLNPNAIGPELRQQALGEH
jgi:tetratricopeptide (TPR) repeat protein